MRLHAPVTPPHLVTATFTATGDPSNSGAGELTELWVKGQNWRWTAKLGSFSVTQLGIQGGTLEDKRTALVPVRIHMLRNVIFWAGQTLNAGAQFRSAAAQWNGRPVTCLLVSDRPSTVETPSRRWDETEYCIDDQSSLLQILSFAPGNYTVYSYAKGQSFHDQPLPDRLTTYNAGTVVLDASLRLEDSGSVDQALLKPTPEMIANGPAVELQMPTHMGFDIPADSITGVAVPVIVSAQVGPEGNATMQELCSSTDPSFNSRALDWVKGMNFGRSDSQRQAYVQVRFVPAGAKPAVAPSAASSAARVPIESYYLERAVSDPSHNVHEEILARRADGATMTRRSPIRIKPDAYVRDLQFPDGRTVTIYDGINAKVTWPVLSGHGIVIRRDQVDGPSECPVSSNGSRLRRDSIEGQDVDVIQENAGAYRLTMSSAPRLGCQALYVNSEAIQPNGSFRQSMETKATKLVMGEPDARLFEIGADLVEMKPSEAQRRFWESLDLPMTADEKAIMLQELQRQGADADRRYQGNHL
jgi:hypothetical protein